MILTIGKLFSVPVESLAEASRIYRDLRDESFEGASTWPNGKVGKLKVSYNGRIWDGDVVVYDPSKGG